MAGRFLRMTRKWLEGAAGLRQETVSMSFTKSAGKRADELISGSLILFQIVYSYNYIVLHLLIKVKKVNVNRNFQFKQ